MNNGAAKKTRTARAAIERLRERLLDLQTEEDAILRAYPDLRPGDRLRLRGAAGTPRVSRGRHYR